MPGRQQAKQDLLDSLFALSLALHHLNRHIERAFRLSLVQLHVLRRLRHLPATSSSVLAEAVGVHPSTLTQTLRRLARKEYVFVTEDPKDERKKLISLTRRGVEAIDSVYRDLEALLLSRGTDDPKRLEATLVYLAHVGEELRRRRPGAGTHGAFVANSDVGG